MRDSNSNSQPRSLRATIRKRTARVTSTQIHALVTNLEAQPSLVSKRCPAYQGDEMYESGWKEVAAMLNSIPHGAVKRPEQWITVWRDFKSRAWIKAAKKNNAKKSFGSKSLNFAPLSNLEKRIVALACTSNTVDTNLNCSKSFPEEDMQQELEYLDVPQNSDIEIKNINNPLSTSSLENIADDNTKETIPQIIEVDMTNSRDSPPTTTNPHKSSPVEQNRTSSAQNRKTDSMDLNRPAKHRQVRRKNNRNATVGRQSDSDNTGTDFLAVAKSNAESMRMLATATNLQAEAAKMQAEAAKAQAETAKVQANALLLLAQATNKIGDALLLLAKKQ